jgi:hypothetical protein
MRLHNAEHAEASERVAPIVAGPARVDRIEAKLVDPGRRSVARKIAAGVTRPSAVAGVSIQFGRGAGHYSV